MPYLFPKVPCFDDYHIAVHEFITYFCSCMPEALEHEMDCLDGDLKAEIDRWMTRGGPHCEYASEASVDDTKSVPPEHRHRSLCRAKMARIAKAYLSGRHLIELINYGSNLSMAQYLKAVHLIHEERQIMRFLEGNSCNVDHLVQACREGDHPITVRRRRRCLINIIREFSTIDVLAREQLEVNEEEEVF